MLQQVEEVEQVLVDRAGEALPLTFYHSEKILLSIILKMEEEHVMQMDSLIMMLLFNRIDLEVHILEILVILMV